MHAVWDEAVCRPQVVSHLPMSDLGVCILQRAVADAAGRLPEPALDRLSGIGTGHATLLLHTEEAHSRYVLRSV